jgi:hypothetical protein
MRTRNLTGVFLAMGLAAATPILFGQASPSAEGRSATAAETSVAQSAAQQGSAVRAGTKINAELVSAIDAKSARPGDRVEARVMKNVKQNGRVVIHKGDRLVGRVTQARADASGKAGSQLNVAFDRLEGSNGETKLNTVLTSVFSANTQQQNQEALDSGPMLHPMSPAGGGAVRGGGGLLGGVGSSVGTTAGTTVGSLGSVSGGDGSTVRGAGGILNSSSGANAGGGSSLGLATAPRAIHLQSAAQAENQTGINSMLSTRHGNLMLDSGTRMQFRVAGRSEGKSRSR